MLHDVARFLAAHTEPVLAAALSAMGRTHLQGYEKTGDAVAAARLRALYELVVRCTEERHLQPMLEHAERIAAERHAAGIGLGEVQTAINVLEEAIWHALLSELAPAAQPEALALVATVLGAAKDRLACAYVSLVAKTPMRSVDLSALFHGPGEGETPEG